jgi:hypothetical protein
MSSAGADGRTALFVNESLESVTPCKDDLSADFVLPFLRHTMLIGLGMRSPDVKGSGAHFPHLGPVALRLEQETHNWIIYGKLVSSIHPYAQLPSGEGLRYKGL